MSLQKHGMRYFVAITVIAISLGMTSVLPSNSANASRLTNYPILDVNAKEISALQSHQIFDQNNQLHVFLDVYYENGSYSLLHIFDNNIETIDSGISGSRVIRTVHLSDGIGVLYYLVAGYYYKYFNFYSWTAEEEKVKFIDVVEATIAPEIFTDLKQNELHIFWETSSSYESFTTTFKHVVLYLNTLQLSQVVEQEFPFYTEDIIAMFWINNSIVIALRTYESTGDYRMYVIFQKYFTNGTALNYTRVIIPNNSYPTMAFSRVQDSEHSDDIYGIFIDYDAVHTKRFRLLSNETFEGYSSFLNKTKELEYGYYTQPVVLAYQDRAYFSYISHYFAFGETAFIGRMIYVNIYTESSGVITRIKHSITVHGKEYYYVWVNIAFANENGDYSITYVEKDDTDEFGMHYLAKQIYRVQFMSTLVVTQPPLLILDLKVLNDWQYFWYKNWPIIVGVLAGITIIYAVFHKRINKFVRQARKFLLRPVIETKSKTKLAFYNLWLFIKGTSLMIWWLWTSNKRRVVVGVLGMTLIVSTITVSTVTTNSKYTGLIASTINNETIGNDHTSSIQINYFLGSTPNLISSKNADNWTQFLMTDIFSSLGQYAPKYLNLIAGYTITPELQNLQCKSTKSGNNEQWSIYVLGYMEPYEIFFSNILTEGSLPDKPYEVLLSVEQQEQYNLHVGDQINITAASIGTNKEVNVSIAGFYNYQGLNQIYEYAEKYGLAGDGLLRLSNDTVVLPIQYLYAITENVDTEGLILLSDVQCYISFMHKFDQTEVLELVSQLNNLVSMGAIYFNFGEGFWTFIDELSSDLITLSAILVVAQFFLLYILIPLLYLGIFLIFETFDLFKASYQKEIAILNSKGLSISRITVTYIVMRVLEALAAVFISIAITFAISPIFIKIDTFLSFNDSKSIANFSNLLGVSAISFVFLLVLSLPEIIKLTIQKEKKQKRPKKALSILKKMQLINIFFIAIGIGLIALSFYLSEVFNLNFGENYLVLIAFLQYLIAAGIMLIFLGIGLILKDLHKLILVVASKISWSMKKSKLSFIFVNIRSDINLFNRAFITWMMIVWIVVPAVVIPINVQAHIANKVIDYHNADVIIDDVALIPNDTLTKILENDEIAEWVQTSLILIRDNNTGISFSFLAIDNMSKFQAVSYVYKQYELNWQETITELSGNNTILTSPSFYKFIAGNMPFVTIGPVNYTIVGTFERFPGYSVEATFKIVISTQNIIPLLAVLRGEIAEQKILLKLKDSKDQINFASYLQKQYGVAASAYKERYQESLNNAIPFYPLMTTEYVLTLLVSILGLVFISITSPIKTLVQRLNKNDILKKIGVPTRVIIAQTIAEYILGSIILGVIPGYFASLLVAKLILGAYLEPFESPFHYQCYLPISVILTIFVILPMLYITIFGVTMWLNFRKYRPINTE